MSITSYLLGHQWVLILAFYLIIALIVYLNRKKFQVENGFIFLYRTEFGIRFINKIADKYKEFVKIVGYSAIGIGFAGMIAICVLLLRGIYELIFVPSAPATLSLVIPGVQIPGSPIFIPFWYGIIALFIVVVIHEFGHGIVARANGVKIKNTGIVFFGPLIGAFVEPDEKHVVKKDSVVQQSIFAAGPFFNAMLAILVLLLLTFVLNPLVSLMVTPNGVMFNNVQAGYPAATANVTAGAIYTKLNGVDVKDADTLVSDLSCVKPNETITIGNENKTLTIITASNPNDNTKGYLGVSGINTNYELKSHVWWYSGIYYVLYFLINLLEWVFTLSIGIGLANLLPLGPVDGGRMLNKAAIDVKGKSKGIKLWITISIITLVVMLVLLFIPIIKSLLFKA